MLTLDTLPSGAIVLADKAYDADAIRRLIEEQGAVPNIPPKAWVFSLHVTYKRGRTHLRLLPEAMDDLTDLTEEQEVPSSQAEYLSELSSKLSGYLPEYAPATTEERQETRHVTSAQRLKEFHQILAGELDRILEILDEYHPDNIPDEWRPIANAVLFLAEVDSPVVKWLPRWGIQELPDALDPRHFKLKNTFYDSAADASRTRMAKKISSRTRVRTK